jgi:hypothetical protein
MLSHHPCHFAGAVEATGANGQRDAFGHARRRALGLGILAARHREAPLMLLRGEAAPTRLSPWQMQDSDLTLLPSWAAPQQPTPGYLPLLWAETIESQDDIIPADDVAAAERLCLSGGVLFRFASLQACVAASLSLAAASRARRQEVRLCIDVERPESGRLETALLPRLRPATPPGQVFATEAAAAEIALGRVSPIDPRAVGRVRSSKRMNRIAMWNITGLAEAARA